MKNNYLLPIYALLLSLISMVSTAQVVANDDTPPIVNGITGGIATLPGGQWFNIYSNDTFNGSVPNGTVTLTQLSSTHPGVNLSGGNVFITAGTPAGTYTIVYQLCETANLSNCDTANVTVSVCDLAAPVIADPTCTSSINSLLVEGLPAGTWTLHKRYNGGPYSIYPGSGSSYLFTNLSAGTHDIRVVDASGCISAYTSVNLGYLDGLEGTLTGTYVDLNGDGVINVGDRINYQVGATNTLECPMTVSVVDSNFPIAGGISNLPPGATDSTSIIATYNLTQTDINQGSVNHWVGLQGNSNGFISYTKIFTTTDLSIPSGIRLYAFYDFNGNGTPDSSEPYFPQGQFTYEINNDGVVHSFFQAFSGEVTLYETNPANSYDINFVLSGACAAQYSVPTTFIENITIPSNSGITHFYFPVTIVPCTDLGITIHPYMGSPRPGFSYTEVITIQNHGNQPIPSATITFTKDAAVTISEVSDGDITASGFTLNLTDLQPGLTYYVFVTMLVPALPTVEMGQLLTSTVSITIPDGDSNLFNHTSESAQAVTASYDPNDKTENHGGYILYSDFTDDDYLTYTIRFENTGTAAAEKVVLTDVLDPKLDAGTLRHIGTSHLFLLERVGQNLTITFDNINLPPSIPDTAVGKGFFSFQVKPLPGYAVGDIISNTASIYFDFNPAIVTNTVTTEFVSTLATPQHHVEKLVVYPNPAEATLNIRAIENVENVVVRDILGKIVLKAAPLTTQPTLNVSGLAKGIYFAEITSGGVKTVVKFIKA